jgi:hypothetical protein
MTSAIPPATSSSEQRPSGRPTRAAGGSTSACRAALTTAFGEVEGKWKVNGGVVVVVVSTVVEVVTAGTSFFGGIVIGTAAGAAAGAGSAHVWTITSRVNDQPFDPRGSSHARTVTEKARGAVPGSL